MNKNKYVKRTYYTCIYIVWVWGVSAHDLSTVQSLEQIGFIMMISIYVKNEIIK